MDKSQAISSISDELKTNTTELYAFQPKGSTAKHFIGAAVLAGAATVLATAFLKGFESALQPRIQNWGKTLGTWMSDKLESLFTSAPQNLDAELDRQLAAVKTLIVGTSPQERAKAADEVQKFIQDTLVARNVSDQHAKAVAAKTRDSGVAVLWA